MRDIPPLRAALVAAYPRPQIWDLEMVVSIPDPENAPDLAEPVRVRWTRLR